MTTPNTVIPTKPNWANLRWHDHAEAVAKEIQLATTTTMSCLQNPQRKTLAPESADKGYPVVRYARGDVLVIVGYEHGPDWPYVLGAYRVSQKMQPPQHHKTAAGSGSGSTIPRSYRQLTSAILSKGYRVEAGGEHPQVQTTDGVYVCTLPSTASDHRSLPNAWHGFLRAAERIPPA